MMEKDLYIVVMHTPSVVSKIIRVFTRMPYNHVSLSLEPDLEEMYTFGRKYTYFPWYGKFIKESPHYGSLKRFKKKTDTIILTLPVDEDTYDAISDHLEDMLVHSDNYHYDTLGLLVAIFKKKYKRRNHYYCSEFLKDLLVEFGVQDKDDFRNIVRPMDFIDLPTTREIYRGMLIDCPMLRDAVRDKVEN